MEFTFLTYNAFQRPPLPVNDYKDERLQLLKKELFKFDIICLQEMFGHLNKRLNELTYEAELNGYYAIIPEAPSFFNSAFSDSGLVIFSRFKPLKQKFYNYIHGDFPDNIGCCKGVLYKLHIFNTHLQANYQNSGICKKFYKKIFETKVNQVLELKKFINQIQKDEFQQNDSIFVVGDLNIDQKHPQFDSNNVDFHITDALKYVSLTLNKQEQKNYLNLYETVINILEEKIKDKQASNFKVINLHTEYCQMNKKNELFTTFGEVKLDVATNTYIPFEKVLTNQGALMSQQCIDYILQLVPLEKDNKFQKENAKKLKMKNLEIEKFEVSHPSFSQLSDHFGISIRFEY